MELLLQKQLCLTLLLKGIVNDLVSVSYKWCRNKLVSPIQLYPLTVISIMSSTYLCSFCCHWFVVFSNHRLFIEQVRSRSKCAIIFLPLLLDVYDFQAFIRFWSLSSTNFLSRIQKGFFFPSFIRNLMRFFNHFLTRGSLTLWWGNLGQ